MSNTFEALCKRLSALSLFISAIGLVLMVLIITYQVFARYVLNDSPSWTEQAALLIMLWFILFAAAAGVREGFHIRMSLLEDNLTGVWKKRVQVFSHTVVMVFGLAMLVFGADLVIQTWQHTIPALGLPRGVAYIPISISGLLIALFAVENIIAVLQGKELVSSWN